MKHRNRASLVCYSKIALYKFTTMIPIAVCLIDVAEESSKLCTENGTWYTVDGLEWTDFTPCLESHVGLYTTACFNQSINQLISQTDRQLNSQTVRQSSNQAINQLANQSVKQSVSPAINQPVSQLVNQSETSSVSQSVNHFLYIKSNWTQRRSYYL